MDSGACAPSCMLFGAGSKSTNTKERRKLAKIDLAQKGKADRLVSKGQLRHSKAITDKKYQLQALARMDQKKREDTFEKAHSDKIGKKHADKVLKMSAIGSGQSVAHADEHCCDQCSLPVPLLCWRYKLRFQLLNLKFTAQNANMNQMSTQFSSDAALRY